MAEELLNAFEARPHYGRGRTSLFFLRSLVAQILMYGWMVGVLFFCWPILWISETFPFRLFTFLTRSALFFMKYMLRIQFKFEGIEIFEKTMQDYGPFIIACKHQSAFETIIFSQFLKKFNVVFKSELLRIPVLRSYLKHLRFIPVDRKEGKKSLLTLVEKGKESMQENRPLLIFPEGARAQFGKRGRYHAGVAILYDRLKVPIVPVAHNAGALWEKKSIIKYPGTITLRVLPPIAPGLSVNEALARVEDQIETACERLK